MLGEDPTGEIKRKDGSAHVLNLRHYLDLLREDQDLQAELLRAWAMGALLTIGDPTRSASLLRPGNHCLS